MSSTDPEIMSRLQAELDAATTREATLEVLARMTRPQLRAFLHKAKTSLEISLGISFLREPLTTATVESTVSIPNETATTFATEPSPTADASNEATRAAEPSPTAHPDSSEAAHTASEVAEALSDASVDRPVANKPLAGKIIEPYGRIDTVDETGAIIEGTVGKDNTSLNLHHPLKIDDNTRNELDLQDGDSFDLRAKNEALLAENEALLAENEALRVENEALRAQLR